MINTTFIMLIGLPGSGKSEMAKKYADTYNAAILSSDRIRKDLFGSEDEQCNNDIVFTKLFELTKTNLLDGKSVVYDATNVSYKRRRAFLNSITFTGCRKIAVVVAAPLKVCIERQSLRERKVPTEVIMRMYEHFDTPYYYEGWDEIVLEYTSDHPNSRYIDELLSGSSSLFDFNQMNPHHSLPLGLHMMAAYDLIKAKSNNIPLIYAALLHDIGKQFTQRFDSDGVAHYYQHQHVSAYESLFEPCYGQRDDVLRRAAYILWHMQPFFIKDEKQKIKYVSLLGEDFYKDIELLHICDTGAM